MLGTPQTLWYEAGIILGSTQIPAFPGFEAGTDENYMFPEQTGNFWDFNYAPGLQLPMVDVRIAVRDKASEALAATILNYWFTRSADTANDTSEISGGITFYDGADAYLLSGAKAESFSMSTAQRDYFNMSCRFVGTTWATTTVPTLAAWDNSPPLVFSNVNFSGALANIVRRFTLNFQNNHYPNPALNGLSTPQAWNAGTRKAEIDITVRAKDTVPASGTAFNMVITGVNITRTFTFNNPILLNPRKRRVDKEEVVRNYRYNLAGATSNSTPPISFS